MTIEEKIKNLPLPVRQRFVGLTDEQKIEKIKEYEKEMDAKVHADIQAYVSKMISKGHKHRQVKKMVFKKFKVHIL